LLDRFYDENYKEVSNDNVVFLVANRLFGSSIRGRVRVRVGVSVTVRVRMRVSVTITLAIEE